jgi:hypothetical protein
MRGSAIKVPWRGKREAAKRGAWAPAKGDAFASNKAGLPSNGPASSAPAKLRYGQEDGFCVLAET